MTASPSHGMARGGGPSREPCPLTVEHMGLEYVGEVVALERWDAQWGRPLEGDAYFRVVLLNDRGEVNPDELQDSRIAVCIPSRRASRRGPDVTSELSAIRETQALYLTERGEGADIVRGYLRDQREDLERRLVADEAARYAGGRIVSPTVFPNDLDWVFAGADAGEWYRRLAMALLSWAYPSPPVDSDTLPGPLRSPDAPAILRAILAEGAEQGSSLERFGPALGLSSTADPSSFDPSGCQVFRDIAEELETRPEDAPWSDIQRRLAHGLGLTHRLASLYVLAFVHYARPETGLSLVRGHGVHLWDRRPLQGDTLSREFLPLVAWPEDLLSGEIRALRLIPDQVTWNGALAYSSILCQGLEEAEGGSTEAASQERELLGNLGTLAMDVEHALEVVDRLSELLPGPGLEETGAGLARLRRLCDAPDFRSLYSEARTLDGGPRRLMLDVQVPGRVLRLGESLDEVGSVGAYLAGVGSSVGGQLALDRDALLAEMSPEELVAGPERWPAITARFREYHARYRRTYTNHHARYQLQASDVSAVLDDCRQKIHALSLLNSIGELGDPVGPDLGRRYVDLGPEVKLCPVDTGALDLEVSPICESCGVALGDLPPRREVGLFARDLERALGEQGRRLSTILVQRILQGRVDHRLENLLKIVQASDLSSLSSVLDYELAGFIQECLRVP